VGLTGRPSESLLEYIDFNYLSVVDCVGLLYGKTVIGAVHYETSLAVHLVYHQQLCYSYSHLLIILTSNTDGDSYEF
jgi:hypothetical protein